jgi:plastocyanin
MKFFVVALGALVLAGPAQAAVADVAISGQTFHPSSTTIDQGDSVRCTNKDFVTHTVTFSGFGGTLGTGAIFEHVFDSAGAFSYLCTIHSGMTGSVTVYGPTALAQALPLTPDIGESVGFDGTGSSHNDPAGTTDSYAWAFDDSATDTGGTVSHSYAAAGIYDVVLTSQPSTMTTTLAYMTKPGTARAPSDYGARSGTLTFQPGQTMKTVAVPIKGDRRKERNETFTVRISSPSNAFISDDRGLGTIVNDD